MHDISSRLLPVVEFVYAAVEDSALRGALAKAIGSAVYAEGVVWRVNRSEYLTPSPEPSPHRLVARIAAWEGAEIEVVACRNELALPFADAERRLLAAIMPHLARAARLGSWGLDGAVCMASTAAVNPTIHGTADVTRDVF